MTAKLTVLQRAYNTLRSAYRAEGIEPGSIRMIGIKKQWNVVLATRGQAGLALNFTGEHAVYEQNDNPAQFESFKVNIGRNLMDFAGELAASEDLQQRSLCLAAMNALSQPLTDLEKMRRRGLDISGEEMRDFVRPEDIVTIIGYGGVVRFFAGKCHELHVSDMRPLDTFQSLLIGDKIETGPRDITLHTADENEAVVSRSDVVIITACTLVNDTFDEVVGYARKARVVGIYGPSAELLPEALFENGINFIRSYRASDPKRFEFDMYNDADMEAALKTYHQTYHVYNF